ncbi:hypothetical protein COCC4DRAFT_75351 [Bipolaris maydis ATCC 48331]|uniref:Uncharacterized protein n=2 Tax=Cochliobolus heterostrophus TaxID=5016 RepID=M2V8X6_COCH5|nr:uncharacterized protein COCC4DRAFT_75351 [Bipolaris maydis ATCC 48331]EMD96427.1 hypothetical protein COCHEDRAFT_1220067 [Bipolaris maydis C5]KAJ5060274.1 hypothetical protein J3E74DRAFT_418457 [Bipolaris maydis]ENI01048.1 hypothetical protein COCC4DRAFT_75351 [Bipolaris maydis ATCC 48331]KAJ6201888.1 hypothetical protein J3E72DRAFT_382417 [Bipolaris maydis]KAJ6211078.1 hypothetical protein PSV09DRAFT_1220067 [Bipolaris maydis]
MSNEHDDTINATLQIIFGAAGIFSVVIALLGLHHQDALVFVLYRRLRYSRAEAAYGMDDEIVSSDRIIGNQGMTASNAP